MCRRSPVRSCVRYSVLSPQSQFKFVCEAILKVYEENLVKSTLFKSD